MDNDLDGPIPRSAEGTTSDDNRPTSVTTEVSTHRHGAESPHGDTPETEGVAGADHSGDASSRPGNHAERQRQPHTVSPSPPPARERSGRETAHSREQALPDGVVDRDADRTRPVNTTADARADARRPGPRAVTDDPRATHARAQAAGDTPLGGPGPGAGLDMFGALSSNQLLRETKRPPQSGWRYALYASSRGYINLGESTHDTARRELIERVNQPTTGCHKIAMLSLKGGVGKTTITATLGSTLASLRGDRIVALDANPDRGTLSQKGPPETTATVRDLLRDSHRIQRYSDVRAYTSQTPARLEILASDHDPAVSQAFNETDYRRVLDVVTAHFTVLLTDCGTGLMHSAMKGILNTADALVIVASASIDGARSASATLDWLDAHDYRALVSRSIAVINAVPRSPATVDVGRIEDHFAARCRAVCRVPTDRHLAEGAELHLEQLHPRTRDALLDLAATVADGFTQHIGHCLPGR